MKSVHFVGIEGIGMSGLAYLMLSAGMRISGSDLNPAGQCRRLEQRGATIYCGHDASHIDGSVDAVVASAAIAKDNLELGEAHRRNIPVWKYAAMLGMVMKSKLGLAVAGSSGKSTTSGMLAYVLDQADLEPSFVVGAKVPQLGGNSGWGTGSYFVVEACEYARSFLDLCPRAAIITSIEPEHLDYYRDFREIAGAFGDFAAKLPGAGRLVIEKEASVHLSRPLSCKVETYSIHKEADWQVDGLRTGKNGHSFEVKYRGEPMGYFETQLPGTHNVSNSLAVIALSLRLGVPYTPLYNAIKSYRGVSRRFDIALKAPVTIVDDYAHHPSKIKAVLQAARERFPSERLWCVFQPHQASRTYLLFDEFASCFGLADEVIISDIFFARDREEDKRRITSAQLAEAIRAQGKPAHHLPTFPDIVEFLTGRWQTGDVVFVMGAGNIDKLTPLLCERAMELSSPAMALK